MPRSTPRILCALALALAPVHATIYAASGNCDGAMLGCVDGKHQIWSFDDDLNHTASYDFPGNDLPSWLRATKSCLFATVTNSQYLLSYSIGKDGTLTQVSKVDTGGQNPVFIDQVGDFLVAANYHGPDDGTDSTGAGVSSTKVTADCSLAAGSFTGTAGHSVDPGRQGASHLHSVVATPGSSTTFHGLDLGQDAVFTFVINQATGAIVEKNRHNATLGAGPRHAAWHPTKKIFYVLHEMGSFVASYTVDSASDGSSGALTEIGRVSTQPQRTRFSGYNKAAEIVATADGRNIIVSNRGYGPDSGGVTVFSVRSDGTLGHGIPHQVGDRFPRGLGLSPVGDGRTLIVAGQEGSTLTKFTVNADGTLTQNGEPVPGPSHPTTVVFA